MIKKALIGLTFIISFFLSPALPTLAQSISIVDTTSTTTEGVNQGDTKYSTGDYTLDDIVMIAVRASRWILGIVGSLALLMFVYGGFMFLISSGSSDKISKAKAIIVAAIVGLIIVFSSYLIIQFVLKTIGINWDGTKTNIGLYSQENILA
ncbi:MAG TPA: hypothetical protein PK086_01015 [bacterium]|nr:hypothetical protein [bacterium]HQQ38128.1 hypothetical protein [bacterium]